ncbi:MAG TPA: hypothetical protein VFD58_01055 [Blastocatellia bacterium]|nr:hypothetical protein [Blastocatellia bacterium]
MAVSKLEMRVAALEAEMARLKQKVEGPELPWWEKIWGTFANDPDYDKAMELGRKYRESLRPKAKKQAQPEICEG